MTIYNYARLTNDKKLQTLNDNALLLECYKDKGITCCIYLLNGFFVEVTIDEEKTMSILPFKRGYKIDKENAKNYASLKIDLKMAA